MTTWLSTISTSTASTINMPIVYSGGVSGVGGGGGYVAAYNPPAPRELTPLEWLDGQIERTCALARAA